MQIRLQRGQLIELGENKVMKDAQIPYRGDLSYVGKPHSAESQEDAYIVVGSNNKPNNYPELRGIVVVRALGDMGMKMFFGDFYVPEGEKRREVYSIGFPKVETGNGTHSLYDYHLPVTGFSLEVDTITNHAVARASTVDGMEFVVKAANLDERNNASGQAFNAAAILYAIENSALRAIGVDVPTH